MSATGAVKNLLKGILILFFGQIVGGVIAGILTGFGVIPFDLAMNPAGQLIFSIVGISIILGVYSKVSG
ncbi:hypothetical protein Har1130_03740 [Haloarcula sp. CBA1130]|uniref:hypothetical protein n=1 Tax=unclassified Haloarcula TaxID=2624677 RepID=UPI001249143C|nr:MULTISPECIES: hypothetical protein [unclassified Haloarcula]KAA9398509.1 hypothetical protein Har1129_09915 [Haloarcula sp. CBA1129]KAA9401899.1 hypothetical protein Har1130_03740 [Haloarcula sp. CBA1130]